MAQSPKTVLIVEDERPLAHALELKLQHEGYATIVVNNGQAALDALKNKPHIMLLDLMMPIMDGFQVLENLKEQGSAKPIIFALSNLSQHEDEQRVLSLGANKYFIKSNTSLATIVDEVKKSLG